MLVILGEIRSRTARVNNALFRDLTRHMRLLLLLLFRLLRRSLLAGGRRGGFAGLLLRCRRSLFRNRRMIGLFEDLLQTLDLIVLGEVFEDNAQFLVLQNLHMILRSGGIVRQDLRDLLGSPSEIFAHLMDSVLHHCAHTFFLLLPFFPMPDPDAFSLAASASETD